MIPTGAAQPGMRSDATDHTTTAASLPIDPYPPRDLTDVPMPGVPQEHGGG